MIARLLGLALRAPLLAVQAWLAVVTGYVVVLAGASFFFRSRKRSGRWREAPLRLLIPAHNEERSIGRLLESLDALDYPRDAYEVHVVADNCTDETAAIVRAAGANAHERFDLAQRGKGHALRWLMARLDLTAFDAVVIVDADSVVSSNLLSVANEALAAGWELGQVYDGVLNRDSSSAAALRALAFDLHNYVRLLGTEALGASAGLMGNGMIIATSVLQGGSWDTYGLAEDMEAHARLLREGRRVHFLPEASVLAEMPDSLKDSSGQNVRWEAGRIDVAKRYGFGLIGSGLRQGSLPQLSAGIETLVPPQSAQLLLSGASLAASVAIGSKTGTRLGAALVAGQALYLSLGLLRLRSRGVSLRCLAQAPGYVLWKGLLYARVLSGGGARTWTRGARNEDPTRRNGG